MSKTENNYKVNVIMGWIGFIITFVISSVIGYFITLPAINIHSIGFWLYLLICICLATFVGATIDEKASKIDEKASKSNKKKSNVPIYSSTITGAFLAVCVTAFVFFAGIISTRLFSTKSYATRIQVTNSTFLDEMQAIDDINKIALMDTDTARIIGKRSLGSLTEMVSQYQVSDSYSTIDFCGQPKKVSPLEHVGFIKYLNNKEIGIPGYVCVDPVNNTAEFIETKDPIRYSPSSFFTYDLLRHIRSVYKTEVFEGHYFEIDDEGVPYWICPVFSYNSILGAKMIDSVIVVNACDGVMVKYAVDDIPNWVDRVYDGDLLCDAYDDYGILANGFWNSVFSKKGCKMTTDDYGYKVIDGDVWIYTGVTSMANDESNIGFVLMNERTAECRYFPLAGAEEYSAMAAAEGALQDLGYHASFPSLVNIDNVPTYICALKDNGGLVKQYAMIHVEQYNLVATGVTPADAIKAYRQILEKNNLGVVPGNPFESQTKTITVKDIRYVVIEGETYVYIVADDGTVLKQRFSLDETLIYLEIGNTIEVKYENVDDTSVDHLISYTKIR